MTLTGVEEVHGEAGICEPSVSSGHVVRWCMMAYDGCSGEGKQANVLEKEEKAKMQPARRPPGKQKGRWRGDGFDPSFPDALLPRLSPHDLERGG